MAIYIIGLNTNQNNVKWVKLCDTNNRTDEGNYFCWTIEEKNVIKNIQSNKLKIENANAENNTLKGTMGDLNRLLNNQNLILILSGKQTKDKKIMYKAIDFNGYYKYLTAEEAFKFAENKRILNAMINSGNTELTIKGNNWQIPIEQVNELPNNSDITTGPIAYISLYNAFPPLFLFFTKNNKMAYNKLLPRPKTKMAIYTEYFECFFQLNNSGLNLFNQNIDTLKKYIKSIETNSLRIKCKIKNDHNTIKSLIQTLIKIGFKPENIELRPNIYIEKNNNNLATYKVVSDTNFNTTIDNNIDLNKTIYRNNFNDYKTYIYDKGERLRFAYKYFDGRDSFLAYFGYTVFYYIMKEYIEKLAIEFGINKKNLPIDKRMYQYYRGASEGFEENMYQNVLTNFKDEITTQTNLITFISKSPSELKPIIPCFTFNTTNYKEHYM